MKRLNLSKLEINSINKPTYNTAILIYHHPRKFKNQNLNNKNKNIHLFIQNLNLSGENIAVR